MLNITDITIDNSIDKHEGTFVFFHGLGSNGQEMADYVGHNIKDNLPNVKMRFPNAPNSSRSWFDVHDMIEEQDRNGAPLDGNIAAQRALDIMPSIHTYIDRVLKEDNIHPSQLILSGFSQGGPIAFYSAFQRHEKIGGVAVVSGVAIDQVSGINSSPEALIIAGADEPSHFSGKFLAKKTHRIMQEFGFKSGLYLTPNNGHNICKNTIHALAEFTRSRLNESSKDYDHAPMP